MDLSLHIIQYKPTYVYIRKLLIFSIKIHTSGHIRYLGTIKETARVQYSAQWRVDVIKYNTKLCQADLIGIFQAKFWSNSLSDIKFLRKV